MTAEGAVPRRGRELALGALILASGLGARLSFVRLFPTRPISDFSSFVDFAVWMRDHSWIQGSWHWEYLNPGLPLILSILLRLFPGEPGDVARLATAVACGLLPLLPFLLWRGVLPLWVRSLAGLLLAVWPGQVFFSGVVAQDNWVLLPTVALGALAARSLVARERGYPVAAGLLFGLSVMMRQEMVIALLPLLGGAAGLGSPEGRKWRRLALAAAATALPLLLLVVQRGAATGRFTLTSEHGGLAVLGSYMPGTSVSFWADPRPYVAAVEPALLRDPALLRREASRLAVREALRRPGFHAARIAASILKVSVTSEADNLYWSVGAPGTLPEPLQVRGQAFMERASRPLCIELLIIHGLFLAATAFALWRRDAAVLALAAAVLLKVGLHGVVAAQGRYVLAATALEILAITLGTWGMAAAWPGSRRPALAALAIGLAGSVSMLLLFKPALAWVHARDRAGGQLNYRFPVFNAVWTEILLDCEVSRGRLLLLDPSPTLRLAEDDPAPGAVAAADCVLTGAATRSGRTPLALRVHDPYAHGNLPGRVVQRVTVDGAEVLAWDVGAEPWTGWHDIPVDGRARRIRVEILAGRPDSGAAWGAAVPTKFEMVERK